MAATPIESVIADRLATFSRRELLNGSPSSPAAVRKFIEDG
jgi:hypothetical protein